MQNVVRERELWMVVCNSPKQHQNTSHKRLEMIMAVVVRVRLESLTAEYLRVKK